MRRFVILGPIALTALALTVVVPGSNNDKLSPGEKVEAKAIYETKCASCHRLYDPNNYAEDEWSLWVGRMMRKARLDPYRTKLLGRYLKSLHIESQLGNSTL